MVTDTKPLTDDEWREETFSYEDLISARLNERFGKTTFTQLRSALEKYGPDSILESAIMLPREEYEKLEKLVRKAPKVRTPIRRRRR